MLVNLVFVFPDGSREYFAERVDLDYWNIRQFRKLLFALQDKNKDYRYETVKLSIEPYLETPFI